MTAARRTRLSPESDSILSRGDGGKSPEAFRTIGEASEELGLKPHVLRFWETRFSGLKPMKRPDGRRHYRPEDMALLRLLKHLLHEQGLTIRGALKALREQDQISDDIEIAEEAAPDEADLAADDDVEAGPSVRELQDAVREAVERGDFRDAGSSGNTDARRSLETLLADLCDLKSRLDAVRGAA